MNLALQYIRSSSTLLTIIGACLLFLCAQISVPLNPVPVTLQTVAVLVIGLTFNKTDALRSVTLYLAMGALGLPVFANFMGGLPILIGPRGGYLIGFLVSIWAMCSLRELLANIDTKKLLLIGLVGSAVVYMLGVPWLSMFVGWKVAISAGLVPFILPGLVKSVIVAASVSYVQK